MLKSKWSAGLSLLMVFLSGVLVGGFSYRVYTLNTVVASAPAPKLSPEEWRRRWEQDFRTQVKADDQQVAQVRQIMDEARRQFDDEHKRSRNEITALQNAMNTKIRNSLREDQRPLWDTFRAAREAMRHKGDKKDKKGDPKPASQ
jgi:hypothetical protein